MQKVIIVDDNESILEAVSLVLKRRSMEVVALRNPAKLEDQIREHQPALLLMDIFMGAYDGRDVCRSLKNNPVAEALPIILFTAQQYTPESVEASGADAILDKPFSMKTLFGVVNEVLHRH